MLQRFIIFEGNKHKVTEYRVQKTIGGERNVTLAESSRETCVNRRKKADTAQETAEERRRSPEGFLRG